MVPNQLWGKFEFEKEKASNVSFAHFVEETERMKESRKLELNGYLTKPTTRLARYPLLLDAINSHTKEYSQDKRDLQLAIDLIREFLSKVNIESGRSENKFNLVQLNSQLVVKSNDGVDLRLLDDDRQLLFKGSLKKRITSGTGGDGGDVLLYLFDHALLMLKSKVANKRENLKIHRKVGFVHSFEAH